MEVLITEATSIVLVMNKPATQYVMPLYINVYLEGVSPLHIEDHVADPTKEAPLLHYLCTAI